MPPGSPDWRRDGIGVAHRDVQRRDELDRRRTKRHARRRGSAVYRESAKRYGTVQLAANTAKADFNGDSMADLLWQHDNGAVGSLEDERPLRWPRCVMLDPSPGGPGLEDGRFRRSEWRRQAGDRLAASDRRVALGVVHERRGGAAGCLPHAQPGHDTAWQIAAIADINGDARADLIWQHDSGGAASLVHERHNPASAVRLSIRRRRRQRLEDRRRRRHQWRPEARPRLAAVQHRPDRRVAHERRDGHQLCPA